MTPQENHWAWIGASSIGSSHLKAGKACDDAAACIERSTANGTTLIAVVSDGAGSASLSRLGSRIVTSEFCRSALQFVRSGGRAQDVDEDVADDWLDAIRERIYQLGRHHGEPPRSFASTLVGVVVQRAAAAIVHVGDGACALRLLGGEDWIIPSWPAQGEYAATTFFVTDEPWPRRRVLVQDGCIEEIALFTDGLERLALDFREQTAFHRFFETIFPPLRNAAPGRQKALSGDLRAFFDGDTITNRTEDDKTLIMARRVFERPAPLHSIAPLHPPGPRDE